jgi:putative ABC transport system permease protein
VAAARYRTFTLSGEGEPERIIGLTATWNHFTVLGVAPILGRTYGPEEDAPGAPASVAVISHSLWTRRFGQDRGVLGSEIVVDGRPHTVVGVMPQGFRYPYAGELWLPMGIDPRDAAYEESGLNVNARLAPGATPASAQDEMAALSGSLSAERPDTDSNKAFTFRTLEDEILEGVPRKVSALLWAAIFVLLIGAANVGSMILARLHAEELELNVQVALGAGRKDLMRRFLAEGLVLTTFGLALGLVLSGATVGFLTRLSPVSDLGPYFQEVGTDSRVALFGAGLALCALFLATVPTMVELRRGRYASSLRGQGLGSRKGRWGIGLPDLLVAAELAIAAILLTGAGLTIESVRNEWSQDLGLDPDGLYTFGVAPSASGYVDAADRIGYMDAVLERLQSIPGVQAAAYTNMNPMRSHGWGAPVWPEGRVPRGADDVFTVNHRAVSPGYFETAGTRLLSGRLFLPSDGPDDPGVVVLSQRAARLLWPGEEPLGKRLRMGGADARGPLLTVVGVVEDLKEYDYLAETWYRPFRQDPRDYNTRVLELFVRGGGEAPELLPAVRRAIGEVDPGVPVFNVEAMGDVLRFERRVESFATLLLSLFACIGVVLAAVGIYGVLSYSTGRRTREIGLRVALGAGRWEVTSDLLARTLRSCALGLGAGILGALLLSGIIQSLVVDATLFSPWVYILSVLGLCSVAIAAAAGPTLRALRIHPRSALAGE